MRIVRSRPKVETGIQVRGLNAGDTFTLTEGLDDVIMVLRQHDIAYVSAAHLADGKTRELPTSTVVYPVDGHFEIEL